MKNKVVQAGTWYTISNFFAKGVEFLSIPIFTRILTTEGYGEVSLYQTWVSLFTVLLTVNLIVNVGRGRYDFEKDYENFIKNILVLSLVIFSFFLIILIIFQSFFSIITGLNGKIFYFMIFQSYFIFLRQYWVMYLKFDYKYIYASLVNVLFSICSTVLAIYLAVKVFEESSYLGQIIGLFIASLVFGLGSIIYFFADKSKKRFIFKKKYMYYGLALSLPLVVHNISNFANTQIDRIFIDKYLGPSAVGVYSFSYNIGLAVSVLVSSLNEAWVPWMYEQLKNKTTGKLIMISKIYRDVFVLLFAIFFMVTPEIVLIMGPEEYQDGKNIIPIIVMSYFMLFMYTFEVNIEFYYKKTILITFGTLFSALINVGLNIYFIPKFGIIAAAFSTLFSYFVLFLFHYIIANFILNKKIYGFKFHLNSLIKLFILSFVYFVFQDYLWIRYSFILFVIFFYIYYFKKLGGKN